MVAQSQATPAGAVDPALLNRAIAALLKHHESTASSNQLLDDDLAVQVQFTLARIPGRPSAKPIRIDIPHSLISNANDDASVCLIVKDESKPSIQQLISRFPSELACVKKVLTLTSLRTKHKTFEQKRLLLNRYDVFMADDRILPMLSKALGSKFFEKKKQPIPVNVCREEALPFAIGKSLNATFMWIGGGTCVTVRAGNTSMSPEHLASNISSILSQVPLKVPRKWANIKSISVKTTNSVALPIYNKTLEELEEIKSMADVVHTTTASNVGKGGSIEEEKEKKKKRKELAEKSPLAKALKKQKKEQKDDDGVSKEDEEKVAKSKTPKSSKKRKDKSESLESTNAKEEEEEAKSKEVKVKSAKKTQDKESGIDTKSTSNKAQVNNNNNKKTKSIKDKQSNEEANATFIPSKKYTGSKSGYVFRKDKQGLGYYIDVKPVVDKVWLNKLQNSGKNGGGRKSMGNAVKKRRGGGRRSY